MSDVYPLLLRPEFHERVWGSRDLGPVYSQKFVGSPIGEAWVTGDSCRVANGPLAGRMLADVSREYGTRLLGDAAPNGSRFPLLIKFLFPQERLSVQVHPDDEAAARLGQPCGKTECWYVLQAKPGAQIGLGLKPGATKADVQRAIHNTSLEGLLNWIEVQPGEMFYVEAGTVHALGPGLVIVETQQNSDTTYRLYDYGRPRQLHVTEGLGAAKVQTRAGRVAPSRPQTEKGKTQLNLITSPSFVVDKVTLSQPWEWQRPLQAKRSVWCLVAIAGCGTIESEESAPFTFLAGEAAVVPAAVERFVLKPQGEAVFLCSSLPTQRAGQPAIVAGSAQERGEAAKREREFSNELEGNE